MSFGDFHLRVKAVSYRTPDSPDKVKAFYRKELAHFGDVIECKGNRPVGNPSKTSEGLTCDNDKDNHVTVSDVPHGDTELKGEEIPRLCRGGSSSLTFTGVHPRDSLREPTKAHVKENSDGPVGESKPLRMGV
jgi:hypothetical protein